MNRVIVILSLLTVALGAAALAEELPQNAVRLQPARWRATRQILQKAAEQAGFRWAVPATITRRAFVGTNEDKTSTTAAVVQDLCRQTGLVAEVRSGVVVVHKPDAARLKALAAQLESKDERARLVAAWELGWLRDANAWPILAKAAVGTDPALALAAAQALRRIDGERPLDWRFHGVSGADPEAGDAQTLPAPWQAPMGLAFPESVPEAAVATLAVSTYIPLREAAARLGAGLGAKGKPIVEKLAADPSPIVADAANRTLAAWAVAETTPAPAFKSEPFAIAAAAEVLRTTKEHDAIWRTTGRRLGQLGTPEALKALMDFGHSPTNLASYVVIPLAEYGGGQEVIAYLKTNVVGKDGCGLWGSAALQDGDALAETLRPALENPDAYWAAPPEYTAAEAGPAILKPLLERMSKRGHWVCLAIGRIGGPDSVDTLVAQLASNDAGTAVGAAKGLGDTGACAAVKPLIAQLKHPDRLRRHWALLGLSRIGGPEAQKAVLDLLAEEGTRKDRLVRAAAATFLKEFGPLSPEGTKLVAAFEADDRVLAPEYRPRNPKLGDDLPENTEVMIREHAAQTYSSIGETRVVMDWANRLAVRYGGCSPCYSNESFAFDVGSGTWFPIRAADHYNGFFNEVRPNMGCSRGMAYDGVDKLVWIGSGIGGHFVPTFGIGTGLAAYDPATDRYIAPRNARVLPKTEPGEPHKWWTFDYRAGLVVGSISSAKGVAVLDVRAQKTENRPGPAEMPNLNDYPPPAFAYDPVARVVMSASKKLDWRLALLDLSANTFKWSKATVPGAGVDTLSCGGLVYDCMNREMILIGGSKTPTCLYDRKADQWVDLAPKQHGILADRDNSRKCFYDPEHNVILSLNGAAYRYKGVPVGTKGYFGNRPETDK